MATKDEAKAARLAAALRENLRLRKARGRAATDSPPVEHGDEPPPRDGDDRG